MNADKKVRITRTDGTYVSLSDFDDDDVIKYANSISPYNFANRKSIKMLAFAAGEACLQGDDVKELAIYRELVNFLVGDPFSESLKPSPTSAEPLEPDYSAKIAGMIKFDEWLKNGQHK